MTSPTDARSLLEHLLQSPPLEDNELREALEPFSLSSARSAMLDLLEEDSSFDARAFAEQLFSLEGPGEEEARLTALALDRSRPRPLRSSALIMLADVAPQVLSKLSPEDVTLPVEASIEELLQHVAEHEEAADELADLFAEAPSTARPFLVQTLVRMAEAESLPVEPIVLPLLKKKALAAQHSSLIELLAQDAGARGAEYLEQRAKKDRQASQPFIEAAARIRRRLNESEAAGVEAWATSCDASGTYQVLIATAGATRTLAGVLAHVNQGIVDGLFFTHLTQEELDGVLESMKAQEHVELASIAPEEAAAMLARVARQSDELPWAAQVALAAIGLYEKRGLTEAQASSLSAEELEALLSHSIFHAWAIDPSELPSLPPEPGDARRAWVEEMKSAMSEEAASLAVSLARYTAWWFQAKGQAKEGALLAAAAEEAEKDRARSSLLALMLNSTARFVDQLVAEGPSTPQA